MSWALLQKANREIMWLRGGDSTRGTKGRNRADHREGKAAWPGRQQVSRKALDASSAGQASRGPRPSREQKECNRDPVPRTSTKHSVPASREEVRDYGKGATDKIVEDLMKKEWTGLLSQEKRGSRKEIGPTGAGSTNPQRPGATQRP